MPYFYVKAMRIASYRGKSRIPNLFDSFSMLVTLLLITFLIIAPSLPAYGVQSYSKEEIPFGIPYVEWFKDYWNWWINHSLDEFTNAQKGGCLVNASSHIVMTVENADGSFADQTCNITSSQGIMIPMWIAWCDSSETPPVTKEKLADCALARYNIGEITSHVEVDGKPTAELHVKVEPIPNDPNLRVKYNPLLLSNVTEVHTKPFILKWPGPNPNTFKPGEARAGNLDAGAQGWLVFLKPLPIGDHTVTYNVNVKCTTQSMNSAGCTDFPLTQSTYHFHVQ
jgi:hypothetical protein